MAVEHSRQLPPDEAIEDFDYLLISFQAESILYGQMNGEISTDAMHFYIGLLKAVYQRAGERRDGDAGRAD
jgi:hypothetical protein